jgi:hypothetical protein
MEYLEYKNYLALILRQLSDKIEEGKIEVEDVSYERHRAATPLYTGSKCRGFISALTGDFTLHLKGKEIYDRTRQMAENEDN